MFDVFYFGPKPNLFAFELPADSLEDAQSKSRTGYYWYIYGGNDYTNFNFNYRPAPWESQYTHVWADQHQPNGNVYLTKNATADKLYHKESVHRLGDINCWHVPNNIDVETVDYRWSPDPQSPPYIYHFPSQWQSASGVTYTVPGATEVKLVDAFVVRAIARRSNWEIPEYIDFASIEWTWHPNVLDPPMNYHFPVQWNWENIGGPVYRMPTATDDKYITDFVAKTESIMDNWVIPDNINRDTFDFSWVPHPKDPPFVYKFPTVWNSEGGPEYHVPDATQEKYINDQIAETLVDMTNWTVPEEVNVDNVDFSWVPHPKDPPYIYHFGTQFQQSVGLMYTVPNATEIKLAGDIPVKGKRNALEVLDIFFIDMNNDTAQSRFDTLKDKGLPVQKVRYANSMLDTIRRCTSRAKTNKFWVISSDYNYDDFDFDWHAEPWQNYMTHVFPSQWQKWSNTFLINRWEFERHAAWANSLEEFPNLNFVKDQKVTKRDNRFNIYYVDHGNTTSKHQYDWIRSNIGHKVDVIKTRFVDNYLDTFKRIMATAETEYVWIINSICDYTSFNFTWEPEPWQKEMVHVFPSDGQERGDTFYVHVPSFKEEMVEFDVLDFFKRINYCDDQVITRFKFPTVEYDGDNLIQEIKNYTFTDPYAIFTNQKDLLIHTAPCLWTKKDRVVERFSRAGATVAVPRDIKADLKSQIYDYPYIENNKFSINDYFGPSIYPELDIVYISNGEPDEEKWHDHLCYMSNNPGNRIKWIKGVNGRTAAYQAAARASSTPWFFAVFAKLEVVSFDWQWMPDFFQEPKHYIFNSHNPVNGLEYGHQGMICYNKRLVLENNNPGIDFTLTQPHESVPILSGIAHYNQSEWMTWRTAFREVVKLKHFMATQPTLETEHRLNVWCNKAEGNFDKWSLYGANDAVSYYNKVNGDYEKLMLSFDWAWLKDHYEELHGVEP